MVLNTPFSTSSFNIDLLVYANLVSTGAVDLTALRAEVYKTAKEKLCNAKRDNRLSRLVSADYAIQYAETIDLAADEELIDTQSEEFTGYDLEDISTKWIIPTEGEITTLRQELDALRKLVPDLGVSASQIESTFNSTVKDESLVISDEELLSSLGDENFNVFEDDLFFEDIYENLQVTLPEYTVESLSYEYIETDEGVSLDSSTYYDTVEYSEDSSFEDDIDLSSSDIFMKVDESQEDMVEHDSEETEIDESEAETEFDSDYEDLIEQDDYDEEYSSVGAASESQINEDIYADEWEDEFFSSEALNYIVVTKPVVRQEPPMVRESRASSLQQRAEKQVSTKTSPQRPVKPPAPKETISRATPVESSKQMGTPDEEPKDLREFLRKHPNCEITTVYQYFTKKEVQKALLTGRVLKKGNKLRI